MRAFSFMRTILIGLALMMGAAAATACAPIGAYNGYSDNAMAMTVVVKNEDYGPMTSADYQVAARHANSCMTQIDRQQTSPIETAGSMAVVYGGAGAVGVTGTGVDAGYVAPINAASGFASGVGLWGQNRATIVGQCTGAMLSDPITRALAPGTHAFGSFTRTNNPGVGEPAPDWTVPAAPVAGSTVGGSEDD